MKKYLKMALFVELVGVIRDKPLGQDCYSPQGRLKVLCRYMDELLEMFV